MEDFKQMKAYKSHLAPPIVLEHSLTHKKYPIKTNDTKWPISHRMVQNTFHGPFRQTICDRKQRIDRGYRIGQTSDMVQIYWTQFLQQPITGNDRQFLEKVYTKIFPPIFGHCVKSIDHFRKCFIMLIPRINKKSILVTTFNRHQGHK